MKRIGRAVDEMLIYKEDKNDLPVLIWPKIIDFNHWKSFSIIVEDINHYGYGSQKDWLKTFEKIVK
jgi:hypothetical protein